MTDYLEEACAHISTKRILELGDGFPESFRCESCKSLFSLCPQCLNKPCPKCGEKLARRTESFPDNIFEAIRKNNLEKFISLFNENQPGVNDLTNKSGQTLLTAAAVAQSVEICEFLVHKACADVYKKDRLGRTALVEMIRMRGSKFNYNILNLLYATVNLADDDGATPMMFAATGAGLFGSKKGNPKIIKQLINLGADVHLKDNCGKNALAYALSSNAKSKMKTNNEVVELLKNEMLISTAMSEFRLNFDYEFDEQGQLHYKKKSC